MDNGLKEPLSDDERKAIRSINRRRLTLFSLLLGFVILKIIHNFLSEAHVSAGVHTPWTCNSLSVAGTIIVLSFIILIPMMIYDWFIRDPVTFVTATVNSFDLGRSKNRRFTNRLFADLSERLTRSKDKTVIRSLSDDGWPFERAAYLVSFINYICTSSSAGFKRKSRREDEYVSINERMLASFFNSEYRFKKAGWVDGPSRLIRNSIKGVLKRKKYKTVSGRVRANYMFYTTLGLAGVFIFLSIRGCGGS